MGVKYQGKTKLVTVRVNTTTNVYFCRAEYGKILGNLFTGNMGKAKRVFLHCRILAVIYNTRYSSFNPYTARHDYSSFKSPLLGTK